MHTESTDGTKGILIGDVITIQIVDVRGSVALIQVARVAVVIDPVLDVSTQRQSKIGFEIFGAIFDVPGCRRRSAVKPRREANNGVP